MFPDGYTGREDPAQVKERQAGGPKVLARRGYYPRSLRFCIDICPIALIM